MAKAVKLPGDVIGPNVTVQKEGTVLVIRIDMSVSLGESKSGKSINVGSTLGNKPVPGTDLTLGVNCYRKND